MLTEMLMGSLLRWLSIKDLEVFDDASDTPDFRQF